MEKEKESLKGTIGFIPSLATVMGTVIGAGVFFKAAKVAAVTGSASLQLFAWFLAGLITIAGGLTSAELAASIPETGGMVGYIERAYGKLAAFLLGWAQTIVYFPAFIAALALIFGNQMVALFNLDSPFNLVIAALAIIFVTFVNFLGSDAGTKFQTLALILKLIPILLIAIFGLLSEGAVNFQLFPIQAGEEMSFFPALGAALLATMFAYDGWIYSGNIANDMKNPVKDLPRAIIFGIAGVMFIYLLVNAAFIKILGIEVLMQDTGSEAMNAAKLLFGDFGGKLVTVGVLVSVLGALNGYSLTGMRVSYLMAKDKYFFSTFDKLSPKTKVPINSGLLQMTLALLILFVSSFSIDAFDMLTDMTIFVIWIFYTMVFFAVFLLRKREPDLKRPYKVPLYPVTPILAVVGGIFIVCMTLYQQFNLAMLGILASLAGLPLYFWFVKKNSLKN